MSILSAALGLPVEEAAADIALGSDAKSIRAPLDARDETSILPIPPPLEPFERVGTKLARDVLDLGWSRPCEAVFEYLARQRPTALLEVLRCGRLDESDLTFAAEIAGQVQKPDAVRAALLPLLSHPSAVVREGVIYGLRPHVDTRVRVALEAVALKDPSRAVRAAAHDAIGNE